MGIGDCDHNWAGPQGRVACVNCRDLANQDEIIRLQAEVERLRGHYKQRSEDLCDALVSHIEWESEQPQMKAWLLRKQAEAVEGCMSEMDCNGPLKYRKVAFDYAHRLRQQAAALEKGNDPN